MHSTIFQPPPAREAGELAYNRLRDLDQVIKIEIGNDESSVPAWFLHLPGVPPVRIKTVSHRGPFVLFTAYGTDETSYNHMMVAAESVVVSIQSLLADDPAPRTPVGFVKPESARGGTEVGTG